MSFQYPFALFALLAIPVLIIIYILRNRYKEETAPSTYLWELSEKFLKKRNPLRRIEHLLSLIVQILAIAGMAFALAHPQFTLKESADNIVFVLDNTASMQMTHEENGDQKTRFELAKEEILKVVDESVSGCKFTLIAASNDNDEGYALVCSDVADKSQFGLFLNNVKLTSYTGDLSYALNQTQGMFLNGTSNVCYVATDKVLPNVNFEAENLNLIDVSFAETKDITAAGSKYPSGSQTYTIGDKKYATYTSDHNYALTSLSFSIANSGMMNITTGIVNYNDPTRDLKVRINYYVDDVYYGYYNVTYNKSEQTEGEEWILGDSHEFTIPLEAKDGDDFLLAKKVKAEIVNEDCLKDDNTFVAFDYDVVTSTNVLVISNTPLYLNAMFKSIDDVALTVVSSSSYTSNYNRYTGYDLYVIDGINLTEEVYPKDGAVWLLDQDDPLPGAGYTFVSTEVFDEEEATAGNYGFRPTYANNTDDMLYNQLVNNIPQNQLTLYSYQKYNLTTDYTTLVSYTTDTGSTYPIIFAGKNNYDQRQVVFGFRLSNSNLPLLYDFMAWTKNIISYTDPVLMSQFNYEVKDTAVINYTDDVATMVITTPSGKKENFKHGSADSQSYVLEEVGGYEVKINYQDNSYETLYLFSAYSRKEENPVLVDTDAAYVLETSSNTKKGDGLFDNILPVVIVAAVLFAADWIMYAHEQF